MQSDAPGEKMNNPGFAYKMMDTVLNINMQK